MVRLITGSSGSGKTAHLYQRHQQEASERAGGRMSFVFIPNRPMLALATQASGLALQGHTLWLTDLERRHVGAVLSEQVPLDDRAQGTSARDAISSLHAHVGGGALAIALSGIRLVNDHGDQPIAGVPHSVQSAWTLIRLVQNNFIAPGSWVAWDEPGAGCDAATKGELCSALLALNAVGVDFDVASNDERVIAALAPHSTRVAL